MNERDKELADKVRFVSTATPPTQDEILQHFADLIRADERDKYEAQFKNLMRLHELRESQPNKPCCLNEREACAKVVIDIAKDESSIALVLEAVAEAIRARGNT
jgi:hypothetical protein